MLTKIQELIDGVLKGDRRSVAKTITLIENKPPEAQKALSLLYPHTGGAHVIGVTGPTGSGKSTLIHKLVEELRRRGKTVGVVAVDPTSPFTGGAFLGDRVRMQELSTDEGVFIRSMATRNTPGGVARATKDAVKVLDASGKGVVIVETVGAGQSEVEIIKIAHTIVVVLAPGLGDDIQAIKAGLMEIGDIFVVNKADRENVNKAVVDIEAMLDMNPEKEEWRPPVVTTTAIAGEGVTELLDKIDEHRKYLEAGAIEIRRRERTEAELVEVIKEKVAESIVEDLKRKGELEEVIRKILSRETDPYSAADMLLAKRLKGFKDASHVWEENFMVGQRLEKGLTQVYTGNGKGKTSAAFGLALRAIGRDLKVYVIQFIKGGFDYGELYVVKLLPNFKLEAFGRGKFVTEVPPPEEDVELAKEAFKLAREVVSGGEYDIVILDEINVALHLKLVGVDEVTDLIRNKPEHVELVLTGRDAPPEVVELADLVTEMRGVKHPYTKGARPRRGIEY